MRVDRTLLVAALFCTTAYAQESAAGGRPDLSGTWKLESRNQQPASELMLVIEQHENDVVLREKTSSGTIQVDVKCATNGVECPAKIDGNKAKVTYYFNGPMLVEHVWRGDEVTKTRRRLSPDGSKLTVEVMPLTRPGEVEKLVFIRNAEAGQQQAAATR